MPTTGQTQAGSDGEDADVDVGGEVGGVGDGVGGGVGIVPLHMKVLPQVHSALVTVAPTREYENILSGER